MIAPTSTGSLLDLVDIADPIALLPHLFSGRPAPRRQDGLISNNDGDIDFTDVIDLLEFLFVGGSEIPLPYPDLGPDPSPDGLSCE